MIVSAIDATTARQCLATGVPVNSNARNIVLVSREAASARIFCTQNNGTAPPGYFVIGDGAVIGPNQ
jgi:hypothetical protein